MLGCDEIIIKKNMTEHNNLTGNEEWIKSFKPVEYKPTEKDIQKEERRNKQRKIYTICVVCERERDIKEINLADIPFKRCCSEVCFTKYKESKKEWGNKSKDKNYTLSVAAREIRDTYKRVNKRLGFGDAIKEKTGILAGINITKTQNPLKSIKTPKLKSNATWKPKYHFNYKVASKESIKVKKMCKESGKRCLSKNQGIKDKKSKSGYKRDKIVTYYCSYCRYYHLSSERKY